MMKKMMLLATAFVATLPLMADTETADASISGSVVEEGSQHSVSFMLSTAPSSTSLYAFLEPANAVASNLSYAAFFTTNVVNEAERGSAGVGVPFATGALVAVSDALIAGNGLKFYDNSTGHFVYNIRLCSSPMWNPATHVTEFIERQLVIDVTNNFPVIGTERGIKAWNDNTGKYTTISSGQALLLLESDAMRTFEIDTNRTVDVVSDMTATGVNQIVYRWVLYKMEEASGLYLEDPFEVIYTVGADSRLAMASFFPQGLVAGSYKFYVCALDKDERPHPDYLRETSPGVWEYFPGDPNQNVDIRDPDFWGGDENRWGPSFWFEVRIDKNPYIVMSPFGPHTTWPYVKDVPDFSGTPDDVPVFWEENVLNISAEAMGFNVAFSAKPNMSGLGSIPVMVTVTPVTSDTVEWNTDVMPSVTKTNFAFRANTWPCVFFENELVDCARFCGRIHGMKRAITLIAPIGLVCGCCLSPCEQDRTSLLYLSHVHRGGGKLERPDNTLETFKWCWENGSALECDCRKTKDGVGIMLHDKTLKRTARGISPELAKKQVSEELTWAEIKDLDVGSYLKELNPSAGDYSHHRIPTIEETFAAMKGHPTYLCMVDEKGAGPEYIAQKAREAGVLDQVYYTGQDYGKALDWNKATNGGKTLIWIGTWPVPKPEHNAADIARFEAHFEKKMNEMRANGFKGVSAVSLHSYYNPKAAEPFVPRASYLKKLIDEFHAHNIPVCSIPFEGGETEEVYFKLFDLGCDGFSTDYPSVMFSVIRKLKERRGKAD